MAQRRPGTLPVAVFRSAEFRDFAAASLAMSEERDAKKAPSEKILHGAAESMERRRAG
jgi:hypothetical protein